MLALKRLELRKKLARRAAAIAVLVTVAQTATTTPSVDQAAQITQSIRQLLFPLITIVILPRP